MMNVSLVPKENIEELWPSIEGYMARAAEYTYGRTVVADIKYNLLNKDQQLWVAFDDEGEVYGAVVTEVQYYPQMTTLVAHYLGGKKFKLWKAEMLHIVQRFARSNHCKVIESYGRTGWEKVWKDYGYVPRFVFYELPVGED